MLKVNENQKILSLSSRYGYLIFRRENSDLIYAHKVYNNELLCLGEFTKLTNLDKVDEYNRLILATSDYFLVEKRSVTTKYNEANYVVGENMYNISYYRVDALTGATEKIEVDKLLIESTESKVDNTYCVESINKYVVDNEGNIIRNGDGKSTIYFDKIWKQL